MIFDMEFQAKTSNQWQNLYLPKEEVCGGQRNTNRVGALIKELKQGFGFFNKQDVCRGKL